jgi:hypothetical protein
MKSEPTNGGLRNKRSKLSDMVTKERGENSESGQKERKNKHCEQVQSAKVVADDASVKTTRE